MAVGKNKRISKGKKGGKKKATDPFSRKDLYTIKAPTIFTTRKCGKTIITRTSGTSKFFYLNLRACTCTNFNFLNIFI